MGEQSFENPPQPDDSNFELRALSIAARARLRGQGVSWEELDTVATLPVHGAASSTSELAKLLDPQ